MFFSKKKKIFCSPVVVFSCSQCPKAQKRSTRPNFLVATVHRHKHKKLQWVAQCYFISVNNTVNEGIRVRPRLDGVRFHVKRNTFVLWFWPFSLTWQRWAGIPETAQISSRMYFFWKCNLLSVCVNGQRMRPQWTWWHYGSLCLCALHCCRRTCYAGARCPFVFRSFPFLSCPSGTCI